ncbi:MAG: hypothetical protein FWD80_01570 [Propionibacteriaceae bacterium]|nr:hypothetical protein [Propionibacteriaceae bacterium]
MGRRAVDPNNGVAMAHQRAVSTLTIVAVVIVLVTGIIGYSAYATARTAPAEFHFSVSTYDFSWDSYRRGTVNADDPVTIDCLGITKTDLEAVLVPKKYTVSIDKENISKSNASNSCWISDYDKFKQPIGTMIGIRTPSTVQTIDGRSTVTENQAKQLWGSSFAYTFPATFGWGGALWVGISSGSPPVAAGPGNRALAILCADQNHCLSVTIDQQYYSLVVSVTEPARPPWALRNNIYGVLDPLGVAVVLLETAWRNLSIEQPDLVPITVPPVNTDPYQPLKSAPFPT